jgi:aldehyde:ferredoxin oxidoreductase
VLKADSVCKDYGLDPISAGSVLGARTELKAGIIEANGLESMLLEVGEGSNLGNGAREYL